MAAWTVSLDKKPVFEPPNAVAYFTFKSADGRETPGVRVPYPNETALLIYLAKECARLAAIDDQNEAARALVANTTLSVGDIQLPDISEQQAAEAQSREREAKVAAALRQKQLADAAEIDPSLTADAEAIAVVKG